MDLGRELYLHIIRGLSKQSVAERATGSTNLDEDNLLFDGHSSVKSTVTNFCKAAQKFVLNLIYRDYIKIYCNGICIMYLIL